METKNLTKKRLLALALSLSMVSGYMAPLHAQDDGDDSYRGVQTFSSGGFDMGSDGGGVGGGSVDMEGSAGGGGGNLFGDYTGSSQADMNAMMNSAPPPELVDSSSNDSNTNVNLFGTYDGSSQGGVNATFNGTQPPLQDAQNIGDSNNNDGSGTGVLLAATVLGALPKQGLVGVFMDAFNGVLKNGDMTSSATWEQAYQAGKQALSQWQGDGAYTMSNAQQTIDNLTSELEQNQAALESAAADVGTAALGMATPAINPNETFCPGSGGWAPCANQPAPAPTLLQQTGTYVSNQVSRFGNWLQGCAFAGKC